MPLDGGNGHCGYAQSSIEALMHEVWQYIVPGCQQYAVWRVFNALVDGVVLGSWAV